jgi:hypothetical protein
LVENPEFLFFQSLAQFVVEFADCLAVAVEVLAGPCAAHFPATLGGIHCDIAASQQFGGTDPVIAGTAGEADAGADGNIAFLQSQRLAQFGQDAAADAFEDRSGNGADLEDRELVTPEAIAAGFFAAQPGENLCALDDELVAEQVAEVIVDLLEAIEVDKRERDLFAAARIRSMR